MIARAFSWTWNRLRPTEGWLPVFLLGGAITSLVMAVLAAGWVPEDGVMIPTAVFGGLLGLLLAKRPLAPRLAWTLISLYGLLITFIDLARLWPFDYLAFDERLTLWQFWRQNGALYFDRAASWIQAVFTGGSSQETIIFATGMGLLTWFLAAYAAWSTFRRHQPLLGLSLLGLAVAVNGYYGSAPIYWAAFFVALTAVLTAVIHYATLEQEWEQHHVDFSAEIRMEQALYAVVIATVLLTLALVLPGVPVTEIAERLIQGPAVQEAEETFGRVFAGVEQPRRGGDSPGGVGGGGILPRSYLLGNAPELSERVMMTAVVSRIEPDGSAIPATAAMLRGAHWRALSYDIYTGRGWAISEARRETVPAGEPLALPPAAGQTEYEQQVTWVYDTRPVRYTLGLPLAFDHAIDVGWRGLTDLYRVTAAERPEEPNTYRVRTQRTTADPARLRETAVLDVPPAILARYTALPPTVPQRVHDLAQQVAGGQTNPYDQARALEQFLRQYTYSLDVDLPPANVDPVDYFLFELQAGYCDYYASSMVVLARSLGLPARMAVGFLSQPPDENGRQTVYQINAHSWAEIYFAGYGWVEFEPTAPFASPQDEAVPLRDPADISATFQAPAPAATPPPIPAAEPETAVAWWQYGVLAAIAVLVAALWWWQHRPQPAYDAVWAYGRLQQQADKLGHPVQSGQTPHEFANALLATLAGVAGHERVQRLVEQLRSPIERLTELFVQQQYGPHKNGDGDPRQLWQRVKRPLWQMRLIAKVSSWLSRPPHK